MKCVEMLKWTLSKRSYLLKLWGDRSDHLHCPSPKGDDGHRRLPTHRSSARCFWWSPDGLGRNHGETSCHWNIPIFLWQSVATASLSFFAFRHHMSCEDQSVRWSHFGCWTDAHGGYPLNNQMRHCTLLARVALQMVNCRGFFWARCLHFLSCIVHRHEFGRKHLFDLFACFAFELRGTPWRCKCWGHCDILGMFLSECPDLLFYSFLLHFDPVCWRQMKAKSGWWSPVSWSGVDWTRTKQIYVLYRRLHVHTIYIYIIYTHNVHYSIIYVTVSLYHSISLHIEFMCIAV